MNKQTIDITKLEDVHSDDYQKWIRNKEGINVYAYEANKRLFEEKWIWIKNYAKKIKNFDQPKTYCPLKNNLCSSNCICFKPPTITYNKEDPLDKDSVKYNPPTCFHFNREIEFSSKENEYDNVPKKWKGIFDKYTKETGFEVQQISKGLSGELTWEEVIKTNLTWLESWSGEVKQQIERLLK